jgi:hypothetical protein
VRKNSPSVPTFSSDTDGVTFHVPWNALGSANDVFQSKVDVNVCANSRVVICVVSPPSARSLGAFGARCGSSRSA